MTEKNSPWKKNHKQLISVILVNYNGKKWNYKCLHSLLQQTYKNLEIIFIDNASTDDSVREVLTEFPQVKVIQSKENIGFASGNNLGIEQAKGSLILLMNNDSWISKDFIATLFDYYISHNLDVVAPIEVQYDSDVNNYLGNDYSSTIDPFGHPIFLPSGSNKKHENFFLSGACLLFKKDLYKETGGLDEDFFMYFEDVDWFWRLNLYKKSFGFAQNVLFHHYFSGSTNSITKFKQKTFQWRNIYALMTILKNYSWYSLIIILPVYILQNIFEIIMFLVLGKFSIALSYIQGWYYNAKMFPSIYKKRQKIQSKRRISDWYLIKNVMYFGFAKLHHLQMLIKK